ncbi:hypothetical protein B0A49_04722 [Cryomyces minteri]|uniref:Kinesin motor domain-containing protein n=1 Tax=Cryomyces minteri TaxID=331657 RepID=A0A4U0XFT5_9PEZI|nr:hypothetical protein B0A49_04722 [Cryomyces minteri]
MRSYRSSSRVDFGGRPGGGSRISDEDGGKTAVKVAVRVRPPPKATDPGSDLIPQRFRGSTCQVTSPTTLTIESAQGKKLFVFDQVFGEEVEQEGVWEYLSESASSFVQGYNVSILAYGQSGAGKSYTMGTTGPAEQSDPRLMGVIPRAAAALFEKLSDGTGGRASGIRTPSRYSMQGLPTMKSLEKLAAEKSWQMKATYLEIYNEQLRDLLVPDSVPQAERSQVSIREDAKGRILLTGLTQVDINSIDDLLSALNFGSSIRQTDSTAVNDKSSRSHAVFSLNLVQKKSKVARPTTAEEKRFSVPVEAMLGSESWITVDSKLHFVDLAGSERLKTTHAQGERAKEGISINAGLASLGKVISQLSSRQAGSHVSYRDSRLTRLLQDSLGGNAITYMVACINPAEFHLSETLNTVQYAQRARAIQSKPLIQQVTNDSDKQAIIDRLRAEVAFLRDQSRLSERTRSNAPQERSERQYEREKELQNQLLDVQENYTALIQRHAKLLSEITKARDNESEETPVLKEAIGHSALERLKRSNSFAEAVEQVVQEYETTIQSLEASLSNTRSSLSTTESNLLEKETKIVYTETITQQLQARIQKATDREASNENYLRDLETRVDGATTGEEKSSAMIQELRKELSRARENESSCEDYISTLEERLADAEQDQELMQREIDRLAHVVERQRSVGKLDNLLYELDHTRQGHSRQGSESLVNGHSKANHDLFHDRNTSTASTAFSNRHEYVDRMSDEGKHTSMVDSDTTESEPALPENVTSSPRQPSEKATRAQRSLMSTSDSAPSSAQTQFVADKLETMTQEIFDLRVEHESTVNDYDELSRKYQIALNTLAELQDATGDGRHRLVQRPISPSSSRSISFLGEAGVNSQEEGQLSSSRTLSSELSLVGESSDTPSLSRDTSDLETTMNKSKSEDVAGRAQTEEGTMAQEMEMSNKSSMEKGLDMHQLNKSYADLQRQHQGTLDYVEELKAEIQKAQSARPSTPLSPLTYSQFVRRKSSQNALMGSDRATRSFASLRNIAMEHLEEQPDTRQNFETNLDTIMTELHTKSERVQALEAEIATARKEMEMKMTIISGLTRERSSLQSSSPIDIGVVGQMRDQLLQSEHQIRTLHESHAAREQELLDQIGSLQLSLNDYRAAVDPLAGQVPSPTEEHFSTMPGFFPGTPALNVLESRQLGDEQTVTGAEEPSSAVHGKVIEDLQKELTDWKSKHQTAMTTMNASEQNLLNTIAELQASLRNTEAQHVERDAHRGVQEGGTATAAATDLELERKQHSERVEALQKEVENHKNTANDHVSKLSKLEQSYASIVQKVEEESKAKALTERELQTHHDLVSNLEDQIGVHKSAVEIHQRSLDSLHASHDKELEKLNASAQEAQARSEEQLAVLMADHEKAINNLEAELTKTQSEMRTLLDWGTATLGVETDASTLLLFAQTLVDERKDLQLQHSRATNDLKAVQLELQGALSNNVRLESKLGELASAHSNSIKELEVISDREKKSSRLVEELEDQLSSNYDQHQAANNRLSAMHSEHQVQLEGALQAKADMERELDEHRSKISLLESQLIDSRRRSGASTRASLDPRDIGRPDSQASNMRKSVPNSALPSPPPAIPLPPLPGSPNANNNAPSPPSSRHTSKEILHGGREMTAAHAQQLEDQEARIRTIEKHLFAEKQLTATLEEALVDLETSSNKVRVDMETWKRKCISYENEIVELRKERSHSRYSVQAVEEERNARMQAERARQALEERMAALGGGKSKKKKSALNCF